MGLLGSTHIIKCVNLRIVLIYQSLKSLHALNISFLINV